MNSPFLLSLEGPPRWLLAIAWLAILFETEPGQCADPLVTTAHGNLQHRRSSDHGVVREIPLSGEIYASYVSLMRHPATGDLYGLFIQSGEGADLYRVDETTGNGTLVQEFRHPDIPNLIGATMDERGDVIAIHGFDHNGAGTPGEVFRLNPDTGNVTATGWTTAGNLDDQHLIQYNPDDRKFYHFYIHYTGMDWELRAEAFERQLNGTYLPVPVTVDRQDAPHNLRGCTYRGGGKFVVANQDGNSFYLLTTRPSDILCDLLGESDNSYSEAGLASRRSELVLSDYRKLSFLSTVTFDETNVLDSRIPGSPPVFSVEVDPASCRIYGIVHGEGLYDRLVSIDPVTGAIIGEIDLTLAGPQSARIYAIEMVNGILYGVHDNNNAELCSIDPNTGEVTLLGIDLGESQRGECDIAFHPASGKLYHFALLHGLVFGDDTLTISCIDLETQQNTELESHDFTTLHAALWSTERNGFLLCNGSTTWIWNEGQPPAALPDDIGGARGICEVETVPDLSIGQKIARLRGNDLRNGSGSGQKIRVVTQRKRLAKIRIPSENDGNNLGTAVFRGTRGNRKLKVNYRFGGANVTGEVIRSGHSFIYSPKLARLYLVQVKRKTNRNARRSFIFGFSSEDGNDVTKATVLMKP